ncbi:MAG: hypothetical protein NT162_03640 [Candidatus Woesebacteria bacterium]|nr:hypothetical protein [Candidatus Woesebacteria bacterium]
MWCPICGRILSGKIIEYNNYDFDIEWEDLEEVPLYENLFIYCASCGYGLGDSFTEHEIERDL